MRPLLLGVSFALASLALAGQEAPPDWLDRAERELVYPGSTFITGFASERLASSADLSELKNHLQAEAKRKLSEGIRLKIESEIRAGDHSLQAGGREQIVSSYDAAVHTSSDAEVVGVKTDTYFDSPQSTVYAFAYVNKHELAGYYKASISMLVAQAEGALRTAAQLEQGGEKAKARKQCEGALPLLEQVRYAQGLLSAIASADSESLQQAKAEALRSEATHLLARLQQAVYVYVESAETNFGEPVHLLAPKLKAELSKHGCSFTADRAEADWLLRIEASTRRGSELSGIYMAFLDAVVSLVERKSGRELYGNSFTDLKGGSTDYDRAGRKAYDSGVEKIAREIVKSIEK
ncbi:MAG: hypothetical protein LBS63_02870 [Prevotellaceae bacterium]|jgi:hypothetical protein|nr:hypothetical protein [Prevotellaceae bacterium]